MAEPIGDGIGRALAHRADALIEKFRSRVARVGVIGLGYVGLPFAVEKAKAGFRVTGIDHNPFRVQAVNAGESYVDGVDSKDVAVQAAHGRLQATTSYDVVSSLDAVVICVPTPLTRNQTPDLGAVEQAAQEIAKRLRPGQLVSLESTTYPGTTEQVILPILESDGLRAGVDFFLAHSPERVDPGNHRYTTKNTSKVVGGVDPESLRVAVALYEQTIASVVAVSSAEAAELTKVFENTFRAVNIALVNEMALLCDRMGLDVWEVLDAAFTKPFGIMPFYPGPGVGGHCIPVDPHYLEWKAKELNFNTRFIGLAGEINRRMPEFVREKAWRVLNRAGLAPSKSSILVLGVAYKRDVADGRESPALAVIRLLLEDGASVRYHDPYVPSVPDLDLASVPLTEKALRETDLVIITTDHSAIDYQWVVDHSRLILDTRNATRRTEKPAGRVTLL